jgi:enoyl-CoA hydratase/carnithine racemase
MESVLVDRDDGVVTVTLNRPEKRNAVDAPMWVELFDTFHEIAHRPDDRVVVVTGAGGTFCSGADVTSSLQRELHPLETMRRVSAAALALHQMPKPTIAKVRGVAAGAGWNLALACDLVMSADDARFSQIFVKRALVVDFGGSWVLPRLIGLQRAKELAFLGEFVSAEEALALGLVNRAVPDAQLDDLVDDWARRLAAGPPLTLSMTKALLNHGMETSIEEALEEEARCQALAISTADTREAVTAFVEKREPVFRGR